MKWRSLFLIVVSMNILIGVGCSSERSTPGLVPLEDFATPAACEKRCQKWWQRNTDPNDIGNLFVWEEWVDDFCSSTCERNPRQPFK